MKKSPEIYQTGNPWQKKVYRHMAVLLEAKGVVDFGETKNGNQYKHWLQVKDSLTNFITPEIHEATIKRFEQHKAGDLIRILTNTAASQPYCFNLIIYLQQHPTLADKLFSDLLNKKVTVEHLEPEFTPNKCDTILGFERTKDETIGDQKGKQGTDADVAVFYTFDNGKKGILLIEFKFIEAEFSTCSSYKEKEHIKPICNSQIFYSQLIEQKKTNEANRFLCGYNKFLNWDLTAKSKVISADKIKSSLGCPFRFGLNQLWRNMILAEQVSLARNCDEFGFWVFSPKGNDDYLWRNNQTEREFREVLTELGQNHFKKIYLETILDKLQKIVTEDQDRKWLSDMEERYRISNQII